MLIITGVIYLGMSKVDDVSVWKDNFSAGVGWIQSLCKQTTYTDYEILMVLTGEDVLIEEVDKMRKINSRVRVIFLPDSDSQTLLQGSAINHAMGEYLAFISPHIEVCSPGWLEAMLQFAQFEDTGFVGGRIVAAKSGGEIFSTLPDITNESSEYYQQWLSGCSQHMNGLQCCQEIMLTAGELCLARKIYFEKYGGLEVERFPHLFAFADLSLKFREHGLRNIYAATCLAKRIVSSADNGKAAGDNHEIFQERCVFQSRWKSLLQAGDPFYNAGCYREKNISDEQFKRWYSGV